MRKLPTQLPKAAQPRPLPVTGNQVRQQWISRFLMGSGIFLVLLAGWQWYHYQQALNETPPAPIVNSLVVFGTDAPTVTSTATTKTTASPTKTATVLATLSIVKPQPTATLQPTASATPTSTPTPTLSTAQQLQLSLEDTLQEIDFSTDGGIFSTVLDDSTATPVVPAPITRIVAERIELDAEVIEVGWQHWTDEAGDLRTSWQVADHAVGWHKNSALPSEAGNIVLSAHHNTRGEIFRDLIKLEPGHTVSLYEGDRQYEYVVTEKFIVKELGEPIEVRRANAKWIGPFDEERLTLVTCWPYVGNTHRAIVIAKPVKDAG